MLGFWRNMDDGDKVRLTKMTGILVALLAVFTLLATVSYFFTWKADQSSLSSAVGDISVEVSNVAGKMGYRWADLLVRRWFGLGSLAFVVILFAVSVRLLLHRWRYSMVKTTLLTVTGAMLSSFILAFVSDLSGLGNAFGGGLGGECGESVVKWASVVFGNILTGFMLAFLVIVWLVLASGKFSDWLMSLGKKPVAEPVVRQDLPTVEATEPAVKSGSSVSGTTGVAEASALRVQDSTLRQAQGPDGKQTQPLDGKQQQAQRPKSKAELRAEYSKIKAELDKALEGMLPPVGSTPQEQRNYFSARKLPVEKVILTKGREAWVCNFCGCWHNCPSECCEPWHGGKWVYEYKEEKILDFK